MSLSYVGRLTVGEVFPPIYDLVQKLNALIDAYATVQAALPSLNALLDILATIEGGLSFLIDAPFGLGALKLSAILEFQGALKAMASISIAMVNPLGQIVAAITAMMTAIAGLTASLSLGLPTVSAELGLQLSVLAAVSAAAAAKMAGIQVVIDAAMSLLGPLVNARLVVDTLNSLFASLSATFALVLTLTNQFALQLPNPGVYLFAGEALYEESYDSGGHATGKGMLDLGFPPAGLTLGLPIKTAVMVVDYGSTPATWTSLEFMIRTS